MSDTLIVKFYFRHRLFFKNCTPSSDLGFNLNEKDPLLRFYFVLSFLGHLL